MSVNDPIVSQKRERLGGDQNSRFKHKQPRSMARNRAGQTKRLVHMLSGAENLELDSAIRAYRHARKPLNELTASEYPLPVLGPSIAEWMRELDDGRGFILVRGFPVDDYAEEEAAFAY